MHETKKLITKGNALDETLDSPEKGYAVPLQSTEEIIFPDQES